MENETEKLKLTLKRYKAILEYVPIPIYILKKYDDDLILVYANNAVYNMTKGKIADYMGVRARELFDKDSLIFKRFQECVDKKKRVEGDIKYKFRTTGEKRYLHSILEFVPPDLVVVSTIDITQQRLAEKKLRESEAKYRSIVESSHSGILIVGNDYKFKYVNNKLCEILGYSKEELIGMDFRDVLDDESKELVSERYIRRQRGEDVPSRYEFNIVRKNGEKRRVEIISTVTTELDKGVTTVAQILDITEQKQIERKLMESERKFQKIFEAIPDSFLLINKHNVILDFNIKEKDKHLFNNINFGKKLIDFLPIEYKEEILKIIKEILKTKQPQFIEFQTTHKNKQYFYEIRFLFYSKDSVIAFIRDMTERKKIELLIKEEIRKLKELDELRRDLISTISHEFKTPIMAISGACEILYDGYAKELKDEMFEMLNIIRRNKQRLEYLINNLIDISRSEYKKLLLNKQSHDICIIIREIVNEMQSYSNLRKIDLIMDIPDKLFLDIDIIRMEQVISNLISNAIKNTPPKGKIRISLKTEDNWAILEVKDTGVGLTKNEIKKLFTRFGKIDRIGEDFEFLDIKGSGLGLFISKEIVEKHGGTILAQSKGRFKGSKFTIKLPINKNK